MPDISDDVRKEIEVRLAEFLTAKPGYGAPAFVGAGGSAAIYRVETPSGPRAIKVYDPKFFGEGNAKAEERRLKLQQSLIGHDCKTLVAVVEVVEAHGTGFIEMEFVAWPSLKKVLASVPDGQVATLIGQLVEATTYLEKLDIVHRDIKPENIHVSEDFTKLKLIDLGVARGLSLPDEEGEEATDHGHKRPFIATAQYSSPEYLFRLDTPSPTLWRALNLYQVGAVLHDLINKKPLFDYEVGLGNKWLVARAVLTKPPSFPDADPLRLASLKALASRCLVKDMNTRLNIVSWSDFTSAGDSTPLATLKSKLTKGKAQAGTQLVAATQAKLKFERDTFAKRFCESVRTELIEACAGEVKVSLTGPTHHGYNFEFAITNAVTLCCEVEFAWENEHQPKSATIALGGLVKCGQDLTDSPKRVQVAVATIEESEDVATIDVSQRIAQLIGRVVDMLDGIPDHAALHGTDVSISP